jgi:hypothetical protein
MKGFPFLLLVYQRMSTQENPARTSLAPRSLIMTQVSCFYCNADDSRIESIYWLFGLKACPTHTQAAIRDCNAYLHEEKMVKIEDALRHPVLGRFLISLLKLQNGFPVIRTSGEVQPGWSLDRGFSPHNEKFIIHYDGEWSIPAILVSPDNNNITKNLMRCTPIANFKLPHIYEQIKKDLPIDFLKLLDDALFCLVEGIYINEFEEVQNIRSHQGQEIHPNIPQTENVLFEGRIVQVIRAPSASAAAPAAVTQAEAQDDPTEPSCEMR